MIPGDRIWRGVSQTTRSETSCLWNTRKIFIGLCCMHQKDWWGEFTGAENHCKTLSEENLQCLCQSHKSLKMLHTVEHYVTWGFPDLKYIWKLILKYGQTKVMNETLPLTDNTWLRSMWRGLVSFAWKISFVKLPFWELSPGCLMFLMSFLPFCGPSYYPK